MNELILFIITLSFSVTSVSLNEVLGCGGFLKSHVPIDFSKVEVKLITKQGIVKDKTTAAPKNGYYFVPLYDKGEMLLELSPPPGWSFEPKNVPIFIDGNDLCSQGKDINFVFKGFGITGTVNSLGTHSDSGPEGVTVKLESEGEVRTTVSNRDGNFFFTPVYPRKYKVTISHPKWKIHKKNVEVTVAEGNTELPKNSLVIQGYDVSGKVKSEGESVTDTIVILFSKEKVTTTLTGCIKEPIKNLNVKDNILCSVKTDASGKFLFETLPNGQYYVIPYYKSQNIYYKPERIEFTVNNKDIDLEESFKIIGFSISGKVRRSKGIYLSDAKIILNGEVLATTDVNGIYTLQKINAGNFKLKAEAENLIFDEITIHIDPSLLELPELVPSAFKVCGVVTSDHSQEITFLKIGTTTLIRTQSSSKDGSFCEFLPLGKYEVKVVSDKNVKGLQFYPLVQTIEVSSEKIPNIVFSQLKSNIFGKVQCLVPAECEDLTVILRTGNENEIISKVKGASYSVQDVYPGTYEISLLSNKFCWETNSQTVVVDSEKIQVPPFIQKGYTVVFVSSHNTKINFRLPGDSKQKTFDVVKGRSSFCLEKSGEYYFNLESCHSYNEQVISYKTNSDSNEIILTAAKHTLSLGIQAESDFGPLQVSVKIGTVKTDTILEFNKGIYELDILLEPRESAVVIPQSEVLFFTPPIVSVEGGDDCENLGVKFVTVKGKLFEGKVIPPLAGVTITVESTDSEKLVMDTNEKGMFKFPPLDSKKEYKISAVKDSYVLSGPDSKGNFLAHKLAEVTVEVIDTSNNSPLAGALLSLSGGESYRKNLQSGDDGKISFTSLSPSEYFLRPMMKEYQFEPNSKLIPVQEGETVKVSLKAKRVAFSAYGQVVSLNGEPEVDMIVVAQGTANCTDYSEETTCESTGHFRIRGLQPYCSYKIFVKESLNGNAVIERSAPEFIAIDTIKEDIKDLKLIIFRPASQMDLLVKVYANNIEHYKSLKVKLIREMSSTQTVHTAKIDSSLKITKQINPGVLVNFPAILIDNKPYSLQLESGLQATPIEIHYFNANESFKYFEFHYTLKDNTSDQPIKQTSAWNLIFIFVVLVAAYNIELIENFLNEKFNFNINSLSNLIPVPGNSQKSVTDFYDDAQIDQIVQSINSAKKKPKPKKI